MTRKYYTHKDYAQKKKKKHIYGKDILTVALILFVGILIGLFINTGGPEIITPNGVPDIAPLSLTGFIPANISVAPNIITLNTGCHELDMITTSFQTLSIESGLDGLRGFRPITHDLITDIVDTFDMNVLMIKIENLIEGTYFSKIFIIQGKKVLSLDSKPSDAIAVAVRTKSPVYINQTLMEREGSNIC